MSRYERLQERRFDASVLTAKMANEQYRAIKEGESLRYAIGAMQPIDPEYTNNTYVQGNRVRDQLRDRLQVACEFDYQGSTTNDTHIKARSDIDLLVFLTLWRWVEPPVPNNSPYSGDWQADMRGLRRDSERAVQDAFPRATADISGANAITLEGGSLTRRVDVVPATWSDNIDYVNTGNKTYRGVKVYDTNTGDFILNKPFLFNHHVEVKDRRTHGGMRKAARIMKSLKYDSDGRVGMSSYNIVSIAWNIPDEHLNYTYPHEIKILETCMDYCAYLRVNAAVRNTIRVPDDSRTVFGDKPGASIAQLDAMIDEIRGLISDIASEARRSFAALVEARVEYMVR